MGMDSPFAWLNTSADADVALGALPLTVAEDGTLVRWRFEEKWPAPCQQTHGDGSAWFPSDAEKLERDGTFMN